MKIVLSKRRPQAISCQGSIQLDNTENDLVLLYTRLGHQEDHLSSSHSVPAVERSPGVLPGELLGGAVALLGGRDVGLDVPAEEVLVRLRADVLDDVADAEDELVLDGGHPRVVVQLEDGAGAQEVHVADLQTGSAKLVQASSSILGIAL